MFIHRLGIYNRILPYSMIVVLLVIIIILIFKCLNQCQCPQEPDNGSYRHGSQHKHCVGQNLQ